MQHRIKDQDFYSRSYCALCDGLKTLLENIRKQRALWRQWSIAGQKLGCSKVKGNKHLIKQCKKKRGNDTSAKITGLKKCRKKKVVGGTAKSVKGAVARWDKEKKVVFFII